MPNFSSNLISPFQGKIPEPAFHGLPARAPARSARIALDVLDAPAWEKLAREFEDVSPEQTSSFVSERWSGKELNYVAVRAHGEIIGGAVVVTFRLPVMGWGLSYIKHGPIWRRNASANEPQNYLQVMQALTEEFAHNRGDAILVHPRPHPGYADTEIAALSDLEFLSPGNLVDPNRYLVRADLDEDQQLNSLAQKWRYNLRRSRKNGLSVELGCDHKNIRSFTGLYNSMVERKQFASSDPLDALPDMLRDLPVERKPVIFTVYQNNEAIASAVIMICGDTAYYVFGASGKRALKLNAGYFLQWSVLEHLRSHGVHWYDLGGEAGSPGLAQFKKGLVGKEGCILKQPGSFLYCDGLKARFTSELIFAAQTAKRRVQEFLQPAGLKS